MLPHFPPFVNARSSQLLVNRNSYSLTCQWKIMKKIQLVLGIPEPPVIQKLTRIMKLMTVLLLAACVHVSAGGFSQKKISVKFEGTDIKRALNLIEKKTELRFLYNQALLAGMNRITLEARDEQVATVLDRIFAEYPVGYQLLENGLVVLKSKGSVLKDVRISGKVMDENGAPVTGASVRVKGTELGTATNAEGGFTLNVPDDAVLIVSFVGYLEQEVPVNGRTEINVVLMPSTQSLDQVVVVGYGSQRKVDVTGSVATIKGDEISKQASMNPVSALQGKVAGVQITNSGAPGASPQIRIRGLGTVYGSANPLYVVDGVWFDDISFLNPADIENISILKDASSEAIYGIRAANGVVLITTKKGKGKPTVTYNGFVGMQRVTNQVKMANATEYATLINELNSAQTFANPESFGEGTNWFDVVLRNALITNHHVSIGGSSDRSTYNFSLGYLKQEGIVENNVYDRVTARLQTDFKVAEFFKLGYTAVMEGSKSNDAAGGVIYKAFTAAPIVPVFYDDGTYGDPGDYPIGTATNNPKAQLDFFNQRSRNYRLTGSVFGELNFTKNLQFRTSIGGEYGQGEVLGYNPVYAANSVQFNNESVLNVSRAETRNWILENTLTYDLKLNDHTFKFLAGQSAQRYKSYGIQASARNVPYSSDADLYLRLGDNNTRTISDNGDLATYQSYFGRINYSFKDKYLLTASLRRDGSSKFIGDERWGNFPSIGAGWVISEENFMRDQDWISNLKLRASWGKVGNASVPPNLATLVVNNKAAFTALYGQPNNPATGASITSIVPPVIFWERGEGTDIGIEGRLLNRRLNFEIDYYNRKTVQAIFDIPVLASLGLDGSSIRGNQADFKNSGVEFSLGWTDSKGKDFNYNINANFSINNNEVSRVATGANPIFAGGAAATGGQFSTRTVVGQPIGQFFGLLVDGIFQNQAQITGSAQPNARPGDFIYRDISGSEGKPDGQINALDRVVLGNPNPRYSYGVNTNFSYKQFDFTLDVQGVADVDIYNANKGLRFGAENFSKDFFDNRWHGEGTSNTYPSAKIGGGTNYLPNSWYVEKGDYFRIRNLQLGYALPSAITDNWKIQRVRFYVNAQNAFNFFSYTGFTPEVGGGPTSGGIDNGVYPLSATYNFGVNVTF